METKVDTPWPAVAELAARQHGVIAVQQLLAVGVGRGAIKKLAATGRLHRVYRGVYAVGHSRISWRGRYMGAVLACGDGTLLSHRSAGRLWGLGFDFWKVEVTASGGPKPIIVHRTRRAPAAVIRDGIPVTSLGRTLVDLADVVSATRLERAFADAERLGLLDVGEVQPIPGRRRFAVDLVPGETKSELERRFAHFLLDHDLPRPVFNTLVEGIEVDAVWREPRVIAELDSWEYHGKARKPFEDDRAKDITLQLADYRVVRVTSRMLDRPAELAAQLQQLLSRRAASASGPARS